MPDPAVLLLFHQILEDAILRVQIGVDIHLADIVEQIEIKIIHAAFFQLLFKDLLDLAHIGKVVARELVRQIERFPGILRQSLAKDNLRLAAVIAPSGIVVVDAVRHRIADHLSGGLFIHFRVVAVQHRQSHTAHAQRR